MIALKIIVQVLLCIGYKLVERVIYNRIKLTIAEHVPNEQDQVLLLTSYIEKGFQDKKKTGVVLVDLSAAYATFCKKGL